MTRKVLEGGGGVLKTKRSSPWGAHDKDVTIRVYTKSPHFSEAHLEIATQCRTSKNANMDKSDDRLGFRAEGLGFSE